MQDKLFKYIETSERAFVIGDVLRKEAYYCNEKAQKLYGLQIGTINLEQVFVGNVRALKKELINAIKSNQSAFFYNIMTKTADGRQQLADLQVGYIDREKSEMFIEITVKTDHRMEMAIHQVDTSIRAEGILNFDDNLSLIHCNDHFHAVFDSNEDVRHTYYGNNFSNGIQPSIRESLLQEIHETLNKSSHFMTKMKVITSLGIEKWYSLELQRRTLDNSGLDKIMAYMTNIEKQIEIEEQLDDINSYFTVLQSMYHGMLYRFDIKNRILHRTQEIANSLALPPKGVMYPNKDELQRVIHPDDLDSYLEFIEKVAQGEEGSHDSRISMKDGHYEYHRMTFKALRKKDGTVEEMIGLGQNVDSIRQTEEQLDSVNQYFTALQELSDDMLYRVDLSTKTLYRTSQQAEKFGIRSSMENYPHSILESGIIYPDDEKNYLDYGEKLLNGIISQVEIRLKPCDADFEYHRLTCYPVYGENGIVKEMFGKIVNIQLVRELEEKANFDALTNLLNKRAMLDFTSSVLQKSIDTENHALFFMDLDNFKGANDNLGHVFGDFLLKELGQRLKNSIRQQDLVGRVGGDEFVIFLRDVPNTDILLGKSKMLLSTISEDFFDGEIRHSIHGSLGVAVYPDHGTTYEELYHHADIALYNSKNKGKNMVTIYSPDLSKDDKS